MLDADVEMFAKGLSELRMYVSQQRKRVVPWNHVSDSSFRLGGGYDIFFLHLFSRVWFPNNHLPKQIATRTDLKHYENNETSACPHTVLMPGGEWVVEQRTLQRRGKLSLQRQQLLKEAFFLWQPAEAPSSMFEHPEDPEAAGVTHAIEDELRSLRWQTITQRRAIFRAMVLRHHPDMSESKYANDAIRFLSDVKDWFLAGH